MQEIETFVSIQGNIGSGKTTLMAAIGKYVEENGLSALNPLPPVNDTDLDRYLLVGEPVERWCEKNCSMLNYKGEGDDKEKRAFLEIYYKGMTVPEAINPFSYDFQTFTFTTRLGQMVNLIGQLPQLDSLSPKLRIHIISERSLRADRLFFKNVYESGGAYDFQWRNYEQFFNTICSATLKREDAMIRLNTSAAKSHERMCEKRKREAETKNGVPLAYLQSLERQHEEMYADFRREKGEQSVLDVNFERDMTEEEIEALAVEIIAYIKHLSLQKK